jgi:hypothetical protein
MDDLRYVTLVPFPIRPTPIDQSMHFLGAATSLVKSMAKRYEKVHAWDISWMHLLGHKIYMVIVLIGSS